MNKRQTVAQIIVNDEDVPRLKNESGRSLSSTVTRHVTYRPQHGVWTDVSGTNYLYRKGNFSVYDPKGTRHQHTAVV